MADIYRDAMIGICERIAMQSIRKIIRSDWNDQEKLQNIINVIQEYQHDTKKND